MSYIQTMQIWLSQYGPQTEKEHQELHQILNKTEKKGRFSCCYSRGKLTITDMKHGASIKCTTTKGLMFRLLMNEHYRQTISRRTNDFTGRCKQ